MWLVVHSFFIAIEDPRYFFHVVFTDSTFRRLRVQKHVTAPNTFAVECGGKKPCFVKMYELRPNENGVTVLYPLETGAVSATEGVATRLFYCDGWTNGWVVCVASLPEPARTAPAPPFDVWRMDLIEDSCWWFKTDGEHAIKPFDPQWSKTHWPFINRRVEDKFAMPGWFYVFGRSAHRDMFDLDRLLRSAAHLREDGPTLIERTLAGDREAGAVLCAEAAQLLTTNVAYTSDVDVRLDFEHLGDTFSTDAAITGSGDCEDTAHLVWSFVEMMKSAPDSSPLVSAARASARDYVTLLCVGCVRGAYSLKQVSDADNNAQLENGGSQLPSHSFVVMFDAGEFASWLHAGVVSNRGATPSMHLRYPRAAGRNKNRMLLIDGTSNRFTDELPNTRFGESVKRCETLRKLMQTIAKGRCNFRLVDTLSTAENKRWYVSLVSGFTRDVLGPNGRIVPEVFFAMRSRRDGELRYGIPFPPEPKEIAGHDIKVVATYGELDAKTQSLAERAAAHFFHPPVVESTVDLPRDDALLRDFAKRISGTVVEKRSVPLTAVNFSMSFVALKDGGTLGDDIASQIEKWRDAGDRFVVYKENFGRAISGVRVGIVRKD